MFSLSMKPLRVERALINKWLAVAVIFAASYGYLNMMINPIIYTLLLAYLTLVGLIFIVNFKYFSTMNLAEAGRFLFIFHLLFFAVSALFTENLFEGIWYFISVGLFFLLLMLLFYRVAQAGYQHALLNALFWALFSIALVTSLIRFGGVGSGLIDLTRIMEGNFFLANGLAFSGLQTNQNSFGKYAAIGVALSLYQFVHRKGIVWSIFSLSSMAMFFGFVMVSTSRASMLMALVFILMFCGALLRKRKMLMMMFLSVGSIASAFIVYELHKYLAIAQRLEGGTSTSGRGVIWADAYEVAMEHFFTGVGPLQYEFVQFGHSQHAHNLYVDTFANLGFFGVLTFILFLTYMVLMSFLKFTSGNVQRSDKVPFLFSFCYLMSLLVHQLFEARGFLPFGVPGITSAVALGHLMYIINRRPRLNSATEVNT